jgi:hypothetical protein
MVTTQDTSKLAIGWNSFSLRILDLIFGIIPATFIGLIMLVTYPFMSWQNMPMVFISIIFVFLNLAAVVYVSIVLQNAKMKSLCVLFLSGGLIAFIFFISLPYQVGAFSMPWLLPTTLISVKHIFMLTRPKNFYFVVKTPEKFQKYNNFNILFKKIYLNNKNWWFFQIIFGSLPAIFVLIDIFSKLLIEYNNFLQNYDWIKLLYVFGFLLISIMLLLFIFIPFIKIQKHAIQKKIEDIFASLAPFLAIYFLGGTLNYPLSIDSRFLTIPILIVLFIRRSKAYSLETSEVTP